MVDVHVYNAGNRTTPSYVAFTDTERLIGDAAKNQVARNPVLWRQALAEKQRGKKTRNMGNDGKLMA